MKVAALQMVSGCSVAANLRQARQLLEQAAAQGAELAALPEWFCLLGAQDRDKLAAQEPFGDGPIQAALAQAARELGLWLLGGTVPLAVPEPARRADKVFNSALLFNPSGQCVARYDKIHRFRYTSGAEQFDETRTLDAGTAPVSVDLPSRDGHRWRLGLSVCYDLRFPELYRHYAAHGADLLLVPSAFTHSTGQAHWELLLRARAVENLAYVLAPAQGGLHENGRRTWGHSMVVGPWGQVLACLPEGAGLVLASLNAQELAQRRSQLPALAHRAL